MSDDWRALNRANWDERAALHVAPGGYDRSSHWAGAWRLDAIVESEIGPVPGLRVLHLQCHIGDDSIAIAQRGAREVVGVDFSAASVAAASAFAAELGLRNVRFVQSDVYDTPAVVEGPFDLVFASWGTICWLPDLSGWARVIAHFLRPGGAFLFAEAHPVARVFEEEPVRDGLPGWGVPYFHRDVREYDESGDYASAEELTRHTRFRVWQHTLGDIVGALRGAGLRLDWLREHPRVAWKMSDALVRDADGMWGWPDKAWLPLALSLRAVREA
jgi:SAM-dependent methyltransferase